MHGPDEPARHLHRAALDGDGHEVGGRRLPLRSSVAVTKRKTSGGTMSQDGRTARDVLLGLMKTCRKLGISF